MIENMLLQDMSYYLLYDVVLKLLTATCWVKNILILISDIGIAGYVFDKTITADRPFMAINQ